MSPLCVDVLCFVHTYIGTDIHTCIHAYIHTYMRADVHTCIRTYIHTYIRKRRSSPHTCIYIYNIYIYIYTCIYIYTYTDTYLHICIFVYTYIYIYTHTFILCSCLYSTSVSLSLSLPPSLYIYIYTDAFVYEHVYLSLIPRSLSLSLTLSLSLQLVHCSCGFVSGSYICGLFYAKRDESCNIKFRGPGRQKLASIPHSSPNAKFLQNLSSTNLRTRISRIMTPKSGTPISTPLLYPYKLVIPITSRLDLLQKCLRHTGLAQES